jgi:hypothetical protein
VDDDPGLSIPESSELTTDVADCIMPPDDVEVAEVRVPVPLLGVGAGVWVSGTTLVVSASLGRVAARRVALYTDNVEDDPHFSSDAAAQFEVQ